MVRFLSLSAAKKTDQDKIDHVTKSRNELKEELIRHKMEITAQRNTLETSEITAKEQRAEIARLKEELTPFFRRVHTFVQNLTP